MKCYDYIVVGAGISGCSVAYHLSKVSHNILIIDQNKDVAGGASGAAGAFLSPLLGKPNSFKNLVTDVLIYATNLYKKISPDYIDNCGTTRIPKDKIDAKKFESYKEHMDFEYKKDGGGYYFPIGSVVHSYKICQILSKDIQKQMDTKISDAKYENNMWILNDTFYTKHLILTTGYELDILQEDYLQIRPVWGRRIEVKTPTDVEYNYHKNCSVSRSKEGIVSIGATHHRDKKDVENIKSNHQELLEKASEIIQLEDVKIVADHVGARASSHDYFPLVGPLINMKKTLQKFPYLIHGTHVLKERFERYPNLSVLNGVGGRGFVLAPYLAKQLVENITQQNTIDTHINSDRLFLRFVKKLHKETLNEYMANS
jgi:glycine/D-amino acid oxidase-like deaminating enzyme